MKYCAAIIVLFSLISCKSIRKTDKTVNLTKVSIEQGCAKNVDCTVDIKANKRISYQIEQSTGKLYPKLVDDSSSNVLVFKFKRKVDKRIMDGQYREEVYFEWPKDKPVMDLKDADLQNVHFLFGRFCFCEHSTVGYFKVKDGNLSIKDGEISYDFENGQTRQLLGKITASYE